jgi:16S rRNA (guanine527-N7)-methyltransferase
LDILEESAELGFLGPGPVSAHIDHAGGFLAVLRPAERLLDLGAGGGIPGLVLALRLPAAAVVLLDASERRTDFLHRAVRRLGLVGRVSVLTARAEVAGRQAAWRGAFDAVVARSFGEPAVTAECAAPFLRTGGQLVVSEPPAPGPVRWPAAGLEPLGLQRDQPVHATMASFTQVAACPARFPRRRLEPPLFHVEP